MYEEETKDETDPKVAIISYYWKCGLADVFKSSGYGLLSR